MADAAASTQPVRTSRLVLTPVAAEDLEDLRTLYNDPQVVFWTGPWTRDAVEAWTADMVERWSRDGVGKWLARRRTDGALVGRGGFSRTEIDGELMLELGWVVRDAMTGQGYATEMARAALRWAADHCPGLPVVSFTEVHNRRSRAVMERIGMTPAGTLRRPGLVEGYTGMHADAVFVLYRL